MPTLYDITQELQALDDLLVENGGDVSDPAVDAIITAWMDKIEGDLENKVDGYCAFIREMEARSAARQQEIDRLKALVESDFNAISKLKDRLKAALEVIGRPKVQTKRFAVSVCKNGGQQPVEINEDQVPQDYMNWTPVVNGARIREELAAGKELPFARMLERGSHLRIK